MSKKTAEPPPSRRTRQQLQLRGPPELDLFPRHPGRLLPSAAVRTVQKRHLGEDFNFKKAAKTIDKLQPLVDHRLVHTGRAVFTVKCNGQELPTTASLSENMQITIDDGAGKRIHSLNQLKNEICAKHSVSDSTRCAWKSVFHAGYSLRELQVAAGRMTDTDAQFVDADQSQANYASDDDDSPKVTDLALTHPASAYQEALAAIRDDTLPEFDNGKLHTALRDVVASDDEAAPDALDYLCAAGVPRYPLLGEESLAVLAALRHTHPRYKDMLVTLVSNGFDFNATSNTTGQSAADIVNARAPGFFPLVKREALDAQ